MRYLFPWMNVLFLAATCGQRALSDSATIETGAHNDEVEIGLEYQGDQFSLYGRVPPETTDIVAVLESPHCPPLKVVRKGRVMGLWFGVKQFEVEHLPDLYMVNLTGRKQGASDSNDDAAELLRRLDDHGGAGYESLRKRATAKLLRGEPGDDDERVVFQGLFDLKEKSGLYSIRPNSIRLEQEGTFYHLFAIPDKAGTGVYRITTYVLAGDELLGRNVDEVTIEKVGLVARLVDLAQDRAAIYGVVTVFVALLAGLLVGALFKKGGGH